MRPLKPDAGSELARAICASFDNFGGQISVEELASRDWASVTFTGARHTLSLCLAGAGAVAATDALLSTLSEQDFQLRGHLLADIALASEEKHDTGAFVRLRLEALTVEDC